MYIIEKFLKCLLFRCVCYVIKFKFVIYKLKLILSYRENNFYNYKYIVYICLLCYCNYDMINGV